MAGLRKIPSPWTEAAKGIFHIKGLDCQYAAQSEADEPEAIKGWAGNSSVPVVAFDSEPLRTGWVEILLLAERLSDSPRLIPFDPLQRSRLFGLGHEICGEMGLGWCVRLLMIKAGLDHSGDDAFPSTVAGLLALKYGFHPHSVGQAQARVIEVLNLLDETLGEREYFLSGLSALDVYWATMANLLSPLPASELPMSSFMRGIYTSTNEAILAALTPRLREHQRRIYESHLELPVPL